MRTIVKEEDVEIFRDEGDFLIDDHKEPVRHVVRISDRAATMLARAVRQEEIKER